MATTQLKQEINQIVDRLPNEVLTELLVYLREVEKSNVDHTRLTTNFRKILTEDRELLTKLAQC